MAKKETYEQVATELALKVTEPLGLELVDVEFADFAETGTARTAAGRMVEGERVRIADKWLAHTGEEQA